MISGDAHMLAIDNGANSDYATGGGAAFPVLHAASLDQSGSVKGQPYSHGAFPGRGQYALMTVTDDDDSLIVVDWSGQNAGAGELVYYSFSVAVRNLKCGDANSNGMVTISDAIYVIQFLFNGGLSPLTLSEGDANGSLEISLADAVFLVNYVFNSGPTPQCPVN